MSLFLGPIHHLMWNKIQFQHNLNQYLLADCVALSIEVSEKYGNLSTLPLEEQIDTGNIHGWLQEKVNLVENSYAHTVLALLKNESRTLDELKNTVEEFGHRHAIADKEAVREVYEALMALLLDGMPCDHVNEVVSETEEVLTWRRNRCVHGQFWDKDAALYYELRSALLQGLLSASNWSITATTSDHYRLERIK